jgi:hypothetical protein
MPIDLLTPSFSLSTLSEGRGGERRKKRQRQEQETDKTEEEGEHDDGVSLDLLPWTASSIHLHHLTLLTASYHTHPASSLQLQEDDR